MGLIVGGGGKDVSSTVITINVLIVTRKNTGDLVTLTVQTEAPE
jgi:hypothetical protein